ncbi:MarR family transcriptional regulator [Sphingomonas sp. LH128]|uniref:MarR family winged helix-turn-helix transcriptional regulator n=1 Tax=Sphingomonas sp. LH128 TaxID=473781 RepID=UPI00027C9B54|nr:MarR family transcriptional regulator [Sphingomonas sp. LH128]EJU13511.1 MarR family transcriptional regulator [Sphingomonas sp. LH128]
MDSDLTPAALSALRKILDAADLENRRMAAATGLTPSQALVLRQIGSGQSVTPSTVAAALRFGQATITNIVDKLVAAGLVTRSRSENDKRQILVQATEEGLQRLNSMPFPLQMRFGRGFERLPRWEQAMILATLERIGALISEDSGSGQDTA